jgi:hypothetical protein
LPRRHSLRSGRAKVPIVRVLIAAIACWGIIGCAGAASNVTLTAFRASDVSLFDNAVDLVASPVIVEGESGAFADRVGRADLIASIRLQSLHSELIKRRSAYRLTVKVKDWLKGASTKELELRVADDEPGYRSVEVNEDRLLHDAFIAFVKWEAEPGSSELIAHWHLSPDSPAVREKIDYVLRRPATEPQTEVEVVEPR